MQNPDTNLVKVTDEKMRLALAVLEGRVVENEPNTTTLPNWVVVEEPQPMPRHRVGEYGAEIN